MTDQEYMNVLNNLLNQVEDLKNENDDLRKENKILKSDVASLKDSSTPENISYFERLKSSNDYHFICRMGKQGKTLEGWDRYYEILKEDSEVLRETNSSKCADGRDGFIAEFLFEKNYVYGSKRHILIGYMNCMLSNDKILRKDEHIVDFESLDIDEDESCIDLKLKLILNNGTFFNFPLEIKSIVNGCEGSICTSSPMLSYYVIVRLVNPDDYKALDSFFIMSPVSILKGVIALDVDRYRSTDSCIWKKTGRQLPSNINSIVIKSSMMDSDIFYEREMGLPFFVHNPPDPVRKPSVIIEEVNLEDIKVTKEFPNISDTGNNIRDQFIEILKLYFKDRRTNMPYDNFLRILKKCNGGDLPSYQGLRKLTKILKRFGIDFNTKCETPYISCGFFKIS